ncbi:DUF4149 domain-containing protein [Tateyamaria sp. ANG-S1]|uniref:DUF4149 domain-containing protein n=1 Tax=Tateyamaria sp. ANG-S1 TaxID=1577905 RepID=UPI00057E54C5|nr:DUF4149 domain-containing protein [Tateyamaria sp. ANG-S1]KIC49037.1 3-demethylubiquinone-9 3-methyltransferase [Tateyamaria sp. ANG-S1]
MSTVALLLTALLFGGMTLFSFGFAAVLFAVYGPDNARHGIRNTFPHYYLWVIATSAVAGAAAYPTSALAAWLLFAIALSTAYTRQMLMLQINAATDSGNAGRFKMLHGLSVAIQLAQIGMAGWALALVAG